MIAAGVLRHFVGAAFKSILGGGTVPVLVVVAVVALSGGAYLKGVQHQKAKCTTAALTSTVTAQRRELGRLADRLAAVQNARVAAENRGIEDAAKLEQWKGEADDFKREITGQPDACTLDAGDADRLRRIGN